MYITPNGSIVARFIPPQYNTMVHEIGMGYRAMGMATKLEADLNESFKESRERGGTLKFAGSID